MKIAIVSSYFYPWYGGITEHVFFMYRELKSRGYTVKIITPFDGKDVLDDRNDLIQIGRPISFLFNGSVVKIPFIFKRKNTINRILAEEQFDIVHLHQPLFCVLGLTFLSCIKERKLRGIKTPRVVGTFHACGGGTERFLMKRLGFYFRKFCDDFDLRIAVSSASRDFVLPIMSGNFEIIPNGVDVARFG
jgi:phosphatidylinositol alpha-mannosyltransferase